MNANSSWTVYKTLFKTLSMSVSVNRKYWIKMKSKINFKRNVAKNRCSKNDKVRLVFWTKKNEKKCAQSWSLFDCSANIESMKSNRNHADRLEDDHSKWMKALILTRFRCDHNSKSALKRPPGRNTSRIPFSDVFTFVRYIKHDEEERKRKRDVKSEFGEGESEFLQSTSNSCLLLNLMTLKMWEWSFLLWKRVERAMKNDSAYEVKNRKKENVCRLMKGKRFRLQSKKKKKTRERTERTG